jgi:dipeptidyl aminopeptidase/acylaminoacyl peptidase
MVIEEAALKSDGITIRGRLYLPEEGKKEVFPTVCVCHGLPSGNSPEPGDPGYPGLAETICGLGYAVFIFNFRGTGLSDGDLDMKGWMHDLTAAIDYLYERPETDKSNLTLLGFSAGAAVSVCVAAEDKRASKVIACSTPAEFTFEDPVATLERFRSIGLFRDPDFPPSVEEWTNRLRQVRPEFYIHEIAPRPVILIHGEDDKVVLITHAYRLYQSAEDPKRIFTIPGAGHKLRRNENALEILFECLKN